MNEIDERTDRILHMRLDQGLTLEEISKSFGVTRERIWQIISKTIPGGGSGLKKNYFYGTCVYCKSTITVFRTSIKDIPESEIPKVKSFCNSRCKNMYTRQFCYLCKGTDNLIVHSKTQNKKGAFEYKNKICRKCNTDIARRYRQTESGKQHVKAIRKTQYAKFKHKAIARSKLNYMLGKGLIVKPDSCSLCGAIGRLHAHHDDYTKPFEVTWFCPACHNKIHRGMRRDIQIVIDAN